MRTRIERDAAGRIRAFESRGHAGFGEKGTDIVCAGVSAVVTTAVLGLAEHLGLDVDVEEADGRLACVLPDGTATGSDEEKAAQHILETMRIGLRHIALAYPEQVELKEVAK